MSSKVLALVASGYRPDAVLIVGEQVMTPRGLTGLGRDTLDSSTAEMKAIFDLLAEDPKIPSSASSDDSSSNSSGGDDEKDQAQRRDSAYPVLVHCTQGKDRTGLVVLLLLLLTGQVSEEAMVADYTASEQELLVEVVERMKEIRKLGLNEDYTKCPPGFTKEIQQHLQQYGGVEGYLRYVGVTQEKLDKIKQALLA